MLSAKTSYSNTKISIIYMLACCFFYAVLTCAVRSLGESIHILTVVFYRNITAFLGLFPVIMIKNRGKIPLNEFSKANLLRGVLGFIGMCLWFTAIKYMPISESVSLSFTTPLFVVLIASFYLKEKVGVYKWLLLFVGFIGTIAILSPKTSQFFNYFSILVLLSSAIWAINNIIVKNLTNVQDPELIVFFMAMVTSILSAPFLAFDLRILNVYELCLILIISVSSNLAQTLIAKAYEKTEVTVVMPFDFMRLVFASIIAFFMFDETLSIGTLVGSVLIVGSSCLLAKKEFL